jgi:hypothetical protein
MLGSWTRDCACWRRRGAARANASNAAKDAHEPRAPQLGEKMPLSINASGFCSSALQAAIGPVDAIFDGEPRRSLPPPTRQTSAEGAAAALQVSRSSPSGMSLPWRSLRTLWRIRHALDGP